MKIECMDQAAIIARLESQGLHPVAKQDRSRLIISEKVIRCEDRDTMIAAMGSDMGKDEQIHLVGEAVHIYLQARKPMESIRLIFGKRAADEQPEVENAVAMMIEKVVDPVKIDTEVDFEKKRFEPSQFDKHHKWMDKLHDEIDLPGLAKQLENATGSRAFRWYRPVTGQYWSGRVCGLEVCKMDMTGQNATLNVGRPGKNNKVSPARKEFLDIAKRENIDTIPFPFSDPHIEKVASVIRKVAESRESEDGKLRKFQREHLLESEILRGKLEVKSREGILKPVCEDHPFQFPALWERSASPRFVDVLMRIGDIPYVVELKEPEGTSIGQGYRHAITQTFLYREFVQRIKIETVRSWFASRGLDQAKCRAVVAFPVLSRAAKIHSMLLDQLVRVGEAFGVEIVEIEGFK